MNRALMGQLCLIKYAIKLIVFLLGDHIHIIFELHFIYSVDEGRLKET